MRIIKNIGILGLGAALLFPTSCNEFLEQKNQSAVSESLMFKNEADAVRVVNAIYDTFHDVDYTLKALWYQANFLSQDFKNYGADTFFERYEVPTDFAALSLFWSRSYMGIARANSAMDKIEMMRENKTLSPQLADRLRGEALFLRGLFHYLLASNFGGVPLMQELVQGDGRTPRNTQDEVFAAVVADMDEASQLLPWQQNLPDEDIGRASKGAALAYMGEAQMWLGQYCQAVETFNLLEGRYELEENFLDIHEYTNQNGKESIFEIMYIEGDNMSWGPINDTHWLTTFGMPEEITNFGYAYADPKLYNSYEAGDERKLATVIGPGDEHPSPLIEIKNYPKVKELFGGINTLGTVANPWKGGDGLRSGYYGVKTWRDPNATGSTGEPQYIFSGQNLILLRYGQILLSKAEALYRCNNSNQGAALDIINNEIRRRAGLGAAAAGDFMDVLLQEYRHELAGEFSLWFVLRRSGEHLRYVKETYNITVPQGKDLMPIPQYQIDINPALEQNPGY